MTSAPRLDPQQGLVRGVRAAVLTVTAVGLASLAHGSADGCISLNGALLATGLCWPAAVAVLGARRRLFGLVGWLVLAQVVTHLLLERLCEQATAGLPDQPAVGMTPTMLALHAGAVLVAAVVLSRADAGLWTADAVLRGAARALRVLVLPVLPDPAWSGISTASDVACPPGHWDVALPVRRGPPALLAR